MMPSSNQNYDPFKLFTATLAMWADIAKTSQDQYVQAVERMAEQMPEMLEWKTLDMPMPSLATLFLGGRETPENAVRDAFQRSADMNMAMWGHIANMSAAMPDWAHWSTQVPGRAITDIFDKWQRDARTPSKP